MQPVGKAPQNNFLQITSNVKSIARANKVNVAKPAANMTKSRGVLDIFAENWGIFLKKSVKMTTYAFSALFRLFMLLILQLCFLCLLCFSQNGTKTDLGVSK